MLELLLCMSVFALLLQCVMVGSMHQAPVKRSVTHGFEPSVGPAAESSEAEEKRLAGMCRHGIAWANYAYEAEMRRGASSCQRLPCLRAHSAYSHASRGPAGVCS